MLRLLIEIWAAPYIVMAIFIAVYGASFLVDDVIKYVKKNMSKM